MTRPLFSDFDLSTNMLQALAEMGYERPTPVQADAIPMVNTRRDLMVQAHTGTGKTAAFGIPIVERLSQLGGRGVRALVLLPTRELARQVCDELERLAARHQKIHCVPVYGGASMEKQVAELKFASLVSGTPGRVLDHLRRKNLRPEMIDTIVLDEADEMLSMGFARELDQIMAFMPKGRQTMLFSATIPEDIKRLARRNMREPEFLNLIEENLAIDDVSHHYYMVSGVGRPRDLVQVIEYEEPKSAIIFTNTRANTELVANYLKRRGYDAEFLNGDLPQRDRERIMARTKDKTLRFLVATDIAARGIDISLLSHVINYILPESPEVYIHRTGRTGRAGNRGVAISLIGPREIGVYYYLKRIYKVALEERNVPTQAEIDLRRERRRTETLVAEINEAAGLTDGPDEALRAHATGLLQRDDSVEIVGALIHLFHTRGVAPTHGGILESVPSADVVRPGARKATLAGVASTVSIVQSEFRGLPGRPIGGSVRRKPEPAPEAPALRIDAAVTKPAVKALAPAPEAPEPEAPAPEAPAPEAPAPEAPEPEAPAPTGSASADDGGPNEPSDEGVVRLFVNLGKRDRLDADDLRDRLAELAGLEPEDFVCVDQRTRHSYLTVDADYAQDLIEAVNGETLQDKLVKVEVARQ